MADFTKTATVALELELGATHIGVLTQAVTIPLLLNASTRFAVQVDVLGELTLVLSPRPDIRDQLEGETGDLRATLRADVSGKFPFSYAETGDGRVLMANGIDPMVSWDGVSLSARLAGVPSPETSPTMAGEGEGDITGTYRAFLRYVDYEGNLSDLSPIEDETDIEGADAEEVTSGVIVEIISDTAQERILLRTEEEHELEDSDVVLIAIGSAYQNELDRLGIDLSLTTINGRRQVDVSNVFYGLGNELYDGKTFAVRNSEYDEGHFTLRVDGTWELASSGDEAEFEGVSTIIYTNVEVPTDARIERRQILRNTDGQMETFYVDIDTYDLHSTTFSSQLTDDELSANEAVPLFDDLGSDISNIHGLPPSTKSVVVHHLGRMFCAVEVPYREGHIEVTSGSAVVQGIGTEWPETFVNRVLRITSARVLSIIEEVDVVNQTLTLSEPYQGETNLFGRYVIESPPEDKRAVYYSVAGDPFGWPAIQAFHVEDNGDMLTGLMSFGSFMYILERSHIHRMTYKDNPARDGAIFLAGHRGCLTNRLWCESSDTAYLLDAQGIHAFSGGQSMPISEPLQDLFRRDSEHPLRINWESDQRYWHASYSESHRVVRFFVSLAGSRWPRHAICFHVPLNRWWIEEYKRPVSASLDGRIGYISPFVGVDHRDVLALEEGALDGVPDRGVTIMGTPTEWSPLSLTDSTATFTAHVVNCPLVLARGRGSLQWRRIVATDGTRLEIDRPWLVEPDDETQYIVGGIDWQWRSGFLSAVDFSPSMRRDVDVNFKPLRSGVMDLSIYEDHLDEAQPWAIARSNWTTVAEGGMDMAHVDLTQARGRAQFRRDAHGEQTVPLETLTSVELVGVQAGEAMRVYRVTMLGVEGPEQ